MQKNLIFKYSKLSTPIRSKGRIFREEKSLFRSPYQRDRDRIIHSTAFRRLKHKTQVFINTSGDHYRTRITHSLEVSQIARTISKYFKLNEDLSETLSLAHDLGHTPFGHAGEEALHECMYDNDGFDHNIQTLRIVTLLEKKYLNFLGLNLSIETLDGLIKHNGPVYELKKYRKTLGKELFKNKINFKKQPSLEAQISSISDDIAYNSHDLEDGIKANLFRVEDLLDIPTLSEIVKKNKKKIKKNNKDLIVRLIIRETIDQMVMDVISNMNKNIKFYKIKNIQDVYEHHDKIVNFSKKMIDFDISIKNFLKDKMYYSKDVLKKTNYGKKVIKSLFKYVSKKPQKFLKKISFKNHSKERVICDFIAGMTDRYAINLFKSLK